MPLGTNIAPNSRNTRHNVMSTEHARMRPWAIAVTRPADAEAVHHQEAAQHQEHRARQEQDMDK